MARPVSFLKYELEISFNDTPTQEEYRVWIHEDNPTLKQQRTMKKVLYDFFVRTTS